MCGAAPASSSPWRSSRTTRAASTRVSRRPLPGRTTHDADVPDVPPPLPCRSSRSDSRLLSRLLSRLVRQGEEGFGAAGGARPRRGRRDARRPARRERRRPRRPVRDRRRAFARRRPDRSRHVPRRPGRASGRAALRDRPQTVRGRPPRVPCESRARPRPRARSRREREALRGTGQEGLRNEGAGFADDVQRRGPAGHREGRRGGCRERAPEPLVLLDHGSHAGPHGLAPREPGKPRKAKRRQASRRDQPGRARLCHVRRARGRARRREETLRVRAADGPRDTEWRRRRGLHWRADVHRQRGRHDDRDDQPEGDVPEPGSRPVAGPVRERLAAPRERNGRPRRPDRGRPDWPGRHLRLRHRSRRRRFSQTGRRAPHVSPVVRPREGRRHRGTRRDRRSATSRPRGEGRDQKGRVTTSMNISEIFIRRPVATTLVMLGILFFGIVGYRLLPVSDLPSVDFPTIQVTAALPGASPETMAAAVATPLERQFTTIAGLDSMNSTSILGVTQISLQFNLSRSLDAAAQDVQAAIGAASRQLPPGMPSPPTYQKVNPDDQPVLYIALTGPTLPLSDHDEYDETLIAQRISTVSGVAQVQVFGAQKYAVRVQLDPHALASRGIGIDEAASAVAAANVNLPTGTLWGANTAFTVLATGQLTEASAYGPLIVAYRNGSPVRVKDIGRAIDSVENDKTASWFYTKSGGNRAIVLAIQKQPGENTVEVVSNIRKLIPVFESQLPGSARLNVIYDRSQSIRESVADVKFTLWLTLALVVLVIFLFLRNLSATVMPSLALPLSIARTFAAMYVLGYSMDNLSLMALTLSVGFVVDDAIVVLELS